MAVLFIRTALFYGAIVIFLRIMGKRQLGELQPTEFAVTLLIADLAAIPIQSGSIPVLNGLVPIAVLLVTEMFLSILTLKFRKLRMIISGHPMTIIKQGKIQQDVMKKLRFNTDDLLEELRLQGVSDVGDVDYAVLETNGKMSVFTNDQNGLFYSVISDGKVDKKVMENLNLTSRDLLRIVRSHGYTDESRVFLMCMNQQHKVFIEGKQ